MVNPSNQTLMGQLVINKLQAKKRNVVKYFPYYDIMIYVSTYNYLSSRADLRMSINVLFLNTDNGTNKKATSIIFFLPSSAPVQLG